MIALGVDAGGTGTTAAISRDGIFLRDVQGPAANATTRGVTTAAAAILTTLRDALDGATPDAIHIGAAGAGRPAVASALEAEISAAFPTARVVVSDDAVIALRSAIPAGPGIVLIAGTGSVAYAENGTRRVRVGGHGHLLGDEGSAFALGFAAVRLYARALDGRVVPDETTDLVARALHAPDQAGLHAAIYDARLEPALIAALAPSIIAFAGKGNRASTKLVQESAKDLGDLIRSAARTAGLIDMAPPLALAGGVLRENSLLTFLLETRLNGDFTGSPIIRGTFEPARGALALAEALVTPA